MKYRWLLPFTFGIDRRAIETAARLAEARGATLVPVALISASSERRSSGVRLEYIQQAKDFLVLVQSIAARHHIPIESHEVFTGSVNPCIRMLIQDLRCDGVITAMSAGLGVLLQTNEVASLLTKPPASLVLIRLPTSQPSRHYHRLRKRLLSWFHQQWRSQSHVKQEQY